MQAKKIPLACRRDFSFLVIMSLLLFKHDLNVCVTQTYCWRSIWLFRRNYSCARLICKKTLGC
jgi:hypothetical protein